MLGGRQYTSKFRLIKNVNALRKKFWHLYFYEIKASEEIRRKVGISRSLDDNGRKAGSGAFMLTARSTIWSFLQ